MANKYDYGIYRGVNFKFDYLDKETNVDYAIMQFLNKTLSMFQYENLPKTIPSEELEKLLQINGFAIITRVNGELYAFNGGLGGEPDPYYRPTKATISNPALKFNGDLTIGEDCIVVYNDLMKIGLIPLLAKYSTMINESELTLLKILFNKRADTLITANDDNGKESAERYFQGLIDGKDYSIMTSKLYDSFKAIPKNNIGGEFSSIIDIIQYLRSNLFNELGLNSNYNMKKERMISGELEVNADILFPLIDNMKETRLDGFKAVNEMFGTDIKLNFNSAWEGNMLEELLKLEQMKYNGGGEEVDLDQEETPVEQLADEPTEEEIDVAEEEPIEETETVEEVATEEPIEENETEETIEENETETEEPIEENDPTEEVEEVAETVEEVQETVEEVVETVEDLEETIEEVVEDEETDKDQEEE